MRTHNNQLITSVYLLLLFSLFIVSKKGYSQQIGVELKTGISGINYSMSKGESTTQLGGSIGGFFSYPLVAKKWSIVSGLHIGFHRTKLSLPNGTYISNEIDSRGSAFEFRVSVNDYQEQQQLFTLNIPLLLQYSNYSESNSSNYSAFHFAAGVKLLVPISQSSTPQSSLVKLKGYYPDVNVEVDDLATHGFGELRDFKGDKTSTDLLGGVALSFELGIDFRLGKTLFYTGLYTDYGLKNLLKSKTNNLINYSTTGLNSTSFNSVSNSFLAKEARIFSLGLTLRTYL